MSSLEIKEIDEQGRVVIPKEWRVKLLKGRKVVLRLKDDSVEVAPYQQDDLTRYFDSGVGDVGESLEDWHAYSKALGKKGR